MIKFKKDNQRKKGFTLIEMMVAVSLFVVVAFIVVSALLTLSYAYKKAQSMRLLMDNLNFTIQSMSLNLREGINYETSNCSPEGSCIQFIPIDSWLDPSNPNKKACYSYDFDKASIRKCFNHCPCNSGDSLVVSPEIKIEKLKFEEVKGSSKNMVRIFIKGVAGVGKNQSSFFIQNTVSQRSNDQ